MHRQMYKGSQNNFDEFRHAVDKRSGDFLTGT